MQYVITRNEVKQTYSENKGIANQRQSIASVFTNSAAVLLVFFYLFSFDLFKGLSITRSSYLSILITIIIILCGNKPKKNHLFKLIGGIAVGASAIMLLMFTWVTAFFHQTGDYSLALTITRSIVWIQVTALLYHVLKCITSERIIDIVIDAYILQSILIVLSFCFPSFKAATDAFRDDIIIQRAKTYGGIRGLAISGSGFFGLSISFGYVYLILAYEWRSWHIKNPLMRLACVLLLVFAGSSAGRTSQLGIVFAAPILFAGLFKGLLNTRVSSSRIVAALFATFLVVCFLLIDPLKENALLQSYMTQALSFIRNFNWEDPLSSTTSSDALRRMYFPLTLKQFIVGDGIYQTASGGYYMGTDAGYMRTILYFGIIGLILLAVVQFAIVLMLENRHRSSLSILTVLLLLSFNYKGESLLIPIVLAPTIQLVCMCLRDEKP